jgi:ADP-ribosylglycohydrolase
MMEGSTKSAHGAQRDQVTDRIYGLILGAACANSLGGSGIGLNYKEIAATTGLTGLREFANGLSRSALPLHQAGDLLSDSLLGLCLAETLLAGKGKFDQEQFKKNCKTLLEDEKFLVTSPGATCLAGLRKLADGHKPAEEGAESVHANVAARVFAIGCLPGAPKSDQVVDVAVKQAALSHGDKRAHAAAAVVADSLNYFVGGGQLETAEDVRAYVQREYAIAQAIDERFAESWDDVAPDLDYANPADDLPYSLINVASSVTELVPTAVGIFLIFRHNPEEAICAAARSGGDTDTVATIVGALAGSYHGRSKLPERWLNKVAHKEKLDKIAQQMDALWN